MANLLKKINKTVGVFIQYRKWPLQGNGMAAISKSDGASNVHFYTLMFSFAKITFKKKTEGFG